MASAADDEEYLPGETPTGNTEDEFDFEDEEDERPNRWRGAASTWRSYNGEEIDTMTTLKEILDRDLSVHLYNAFALKQRHRKAQEGVAVDGPVPGKVSEMN